MGSRYWITGVQLGLLFSLPEDEYKAKIMEEIMNKQELENKNV